jgi:hypothetical protein
LIAAADAEVVAEAVEESGDAATPDWMDVNTDEESENTEPAVGGEAAADAEAEEDGVEAAGAGDENEGGSGLSLIAVTRCGEEAGALAPPIS